MCVILVKKSDQEITDLKLAEQMYLSNTHGIGVAASDGKAIHVWKNIPKNWAAAKKFLLSIPSWVFNKGCISAFHYRIATSGTISEDCCHPFVVEGKLEHTICAKNGYQKLTSGAIIMHNGILDNYITTKEQNLYFKSFNDTQVFTSKVIYPMIAKLGISQTSDILHRMISGSRLLIMSADNAYSIGSWDKHEGFLVSNKYFLPSKTPFMLGSCEVCGSNKSTAYIEEMGIDMCMECYKIFSK